jgi:antitoxin ParD1/3/4
MHISLTDKLDEYVRQKVASGLYNNASEVIREALRYKIAAEEGDDAKRQRLREAIDLGWQQADRGELVELDLPGILRELDLEMPQDA